jgi:hypothetical protein
MVNYDISYFELVDYDIIPYFIIKHNKKVILFEIDQIINFNQIKNHNFTSFEQIITLCKIVMFGNNDNEKYINKLLDNDVINNKNEIIKIYNQIQSDDENKINKWLFIRERLIALK